MKRSLLLFIITIASFGANAQKYAYVDSDYILNMIPSYDAAQRQLNTISERYKVELEAIYSEVEVMREELQLELPLLSDEMRIRREDVILTKEKEYQKLQKKYFGRSGDLSIKRKALIEPIQEEIFKALKEIAFKGGYAIIFDKAGDSNMLFVDPRFDLSNRVLENLGYKQ